jgi:hypothetical protein
LSLKQAGILRAIPACQKHCTESQPPDLYKQVGIFCFPSRRFEMTENPSVKSNLSLEAPASWNTKYLSPEGFTCQITLRADSGKELLEKAQAAVTHLIAVGCTPCDNFTFRPRSNGNGSKAKSDNGSNGSGNHSEANAESTSSTKVCPIHNVEMKRWEKNGKIWYSHKQDDGGWCTGKSK